MCLVSPITVKAEISLSNIYISVTDAKTALQDKDTKAFEAHFKDIKEIGQKLTKKIINQLKQLIMIQKISKKVTQMMKK